MRAEHLDLFRDPESKATLTLCDAQWIGQDIEKGMLRTTQGISFPIHNGIPRFVSSEVYAHNFGYQWKQHDKVQLDKYNRTDITRNRLFRTSLWPQDLKDQSILEVGCGSGRFTSELIRTGANVYAFDLSNAVEANFANNGLAPNVCIFQANIDSLPFEPEQFDKVICLGVLQHTPDVESAFAALARMVRPGGQLVIDCYIKRIRSLLHWKYLLRPLTTRVNPEILHSYVQWYVPRLLPYARWLRKVGGSFALRLVPVMLPSRLRIPDCVEEEWAVLNTYDALSATFDQPQTPKRFENMFLRNGFCKVKIEVDVPGAFALLGRGAKALQR